MEKHSGRSPVLIAAAGARLLILNKHLCARRVRRALLWFSPRGAAVSVRAASSSTRLLCVNPEEVVPAPPWCNPGWDWARSTYTVGEYPKGIKVLWGWEKCLYPLGCCCCCPGLCWRGAAPRVWCRFVLGFSSPKNSPRFGVSKTY